MRRLTLSADHIPLLEAGRLTRIAVIARPTSFYAQGRLMAAHGALYCAEGDVITIDTPLEQGIAQARFTGLDGADTLARCIADLSTLQAPLFGYERITDLWYEWTQRYDPQTASWWQMCSPLFKDLPQRHQRKIFRKVIDLRPPEQYRCWILIVEGVSTLSTKSA